jgi:hypothetical protein
MGAPREGGVGRTRFHRRHGRALEELGRFAFDIVGESKYQDNLWCVAQTAHPEHGARVIEPAYLVLENENPYDSNAVRVDIMSLTVGYLSREKALWYRRSFPRDACRQSAMGESGEASRSTAAVRRISG